MPLDPRKYLCDMLEGAKFVVEALGNRVRGDLDSDQMLRFAIERELITVGEALNQLVRVAPEMVENIDRWKDINRISPYSGAWLRHTGHGRYSGISPTTISLY